MPWEMKYTDNDSGLDFTIIHSYHLGVGSIRQIGFSITDRLIEIVQTRSPEIFDVLGVVIEDYELIFFAKDLTAGLFFDSDGGLDFPEDLEDFRFNLEATLASQSPFISRVNKQSAQKALEYLSALKEAKEKVRAKRENTALRRREFDRKRDRLMLAVIKRDGYTCAECGSNDDLTLDHIIPVSRGGTDDLSNLRILCRSHNSQKGNRIQEGANDDNL